MTETLLTLCNVVKRYAGGPPAVAGVSFELADDRPTLFTLAGESGSGKSTIAAMILGFLRQDAGQILYRGRPLHGGSAWPSFRREVQAVFQNPFEAFNPYYPVEHALDLAITAFALAKGRADRLRLVEESLAAVNLDPARIIGRRPRQLSGGQLQRVAIARALICRPRLLVADEPVSMVDASLRLSILSQLVRMRDRDGVSIVYITHDLSTAMQISDFIAVMHRGAFVDAATPANLLAGPTAPYTSDLIASVPSIVQPHNAGSGE